MPKVVSRSAVSSSTDARPTASSAAALRVYYCICGEFIVRHDGSPAHLLLIPIQQLVIDKTIASLPRRRTDGSIIVRARDSDAGKARVFKLNAVTDEPVLLERCVASRRSAGVADPPGHIFTVVRNAGQGGHERQFRFHCPRCKLPIGYQSTPPPVKSGPFIYIFAGALSQVQGQVPADAFHGENMEDSEVQEK
ncbi:hypothetical protein MSAN_01460400 [Mycena sanguinolenta]|uniref:STEEP1 domain-containing protein n=1 Tax=Mycena sanguinolenta TaxID=230812 RepID=A0A8H7D197_9AGAR|nr:hypothetical protein MSAN_01460400 [Mycena sanguinolenta]